LVPKAIPTFLISFAAIATALGAVGCNGSSHLPVASPSAIVIPANPPSSVTGVSINRGSTAGGTKFKIRGTNLARESTVTFGNVKALSNSYDPRDEPGTTLYITSPPHPAGVVDLVITRGDGQLRVSDAFEFVDQETFDFNGKWAGFTIDGTDVWIEFVIRNNTLVSGSCDGIKTKTAVLPIDVTAGRFLAQGPDSFHLAGRIVSAEQATGKVTGPDCNGSGESPWQAYKVN
jgi:hypothetical protein